MTALAATRLAALILSLAMAGGAAAASVRPGLEAEADINNGLLVLAVADMIRNQCPDIRARFFRAYLYVNDLEARARARGYSREEIDGYIKDPTQRARMWQRRDAWIKAQGADIRDPASLCTLGHGEIARGSQIGRLLKAK
ncbi:MAG: hypothetical protein Kow0058_18010 [Roseovarius sp.]